MSCRRRPFSVSALLAIGLTASAVASAAPAAVTGTFQIQIGTLPLPAIPVQGIVDVTGGTLTIPAGIVSTSGMFIPPVGFPLNLITGAVVTVSNGAGQFSVGGATAACPGPFASGRGACIDGTGLSGSMPLFGVYQVKGALAINVPLSFIGVDGELITVVPPPNPTSTGMSAVYQGAGWTTGMARVTTTGLAGNMFASAGTAVGALGAMSSTLTLVTPAHVNVYGLSRLPFFTRLTLHFVPEPGSVVLLGLGLAGLAVASRSRARR